MVKKLEVLRMTLLKLLYQQELNPPTYGHRVCFQILLHHRSDGCRMSTHRLPSTTLALKTPKHSLSKSSKKAPSDVTGLTKTQSPIFQSTSTGSNEARIALRSHRASTPLKAIFTKANPSAPRNMIESYPARYYHTAWKKSRESTTGPPFLLNILCENCFDKSGLVINKRTRPVLHDETRKDIKIDI